MSGCNVRVVVYKAWFYHSPRLGLDGWGDVLLRGVEMPPRKSAKLGTVLSSSRFDEQSECERNETPRQPSASQTQEAQSHGPNQQKNIRSLLQLKILYVCTCDYVFVPPPTAVMTVRIHSHPFVLLLQIGPATRSFFRTSFRTPADNQETFDQATAQ